jgi:hypothetical protein
MSRSLLLASGIFASLLYIGTDVLGGMRYEGYSYSTQTISELAAIGAPSKPLVDTLFFVYDVLMIAFALGVWASAGGKRARRVTGVLLIGTVIAGSLWYFFPVHMRGTEITLTDTMHIIVGGVVSLLILFTIGIGSTAFGKRFRLYSLVTLVILLVSGVLIGLDTPRIQANLPTPWVGISERINVYGYLLWVAVLAIVLLRECDQSCRSTRRSD